MKFTFTVHVTHVENVINNINNKEKYRNTSQVFSTNTSDNAQCNSEPDSLQTKQPAVSGSRGKMNC